MPTLPFLQNFNGLLFAWTLWMCRPNLKFVALPVPEIIAIGVLGGGCEPKSWGRGGRRVSGMVPLERALVTFCRPSIVTFLYLYTFQRYCRFCAPAGHYFSTPPVLSPKISPYSPGIRSMFFGQWRAKVLPVSKLANANLCGPEPPTTQTDRRTDRRTDIMQSLLLILPSILLAC